MEMAGSVSRSVSYDQLVAVATFALFSRVLVITIQIVANLLPDHEAKAFHLDLPSHPSFADKIVDFLIGGFSKWDSSYFLHIAQHGYTSPQTFAFFPLFPFLMRILAAAFVNPCQHLLCLDVSFQNCLLISAVVVNVGIFCGASVALYCLGVHVLSSEKLAYRAALLFCINPASVFMSAAYTESLFALLCFGAMLSVERRRFLLATFLFALSGSVRSNGIISVGFLLYAFLRRTSHLLMLYADPIQTDYKAKLFWKVACDRRRHVLRTLCLLPCSVVIFLPFIAFQVYSFMIICTEEQDFVSLITCNDVHERGIVFANDAPSWCRHGLPIPYAAIQSQYWNVGLMKYYEIKQIPNFVLALPMIILSLNAIANYCRTRWNFVRFLGLLQTERVCGSRRSVDQKPVQGFHSDETFVYVAHLTTLLMFGVTCMHVQVLTRFISSSCPAVFWYAAHLTTNEEAVSLKDSARRQELSKQTHYSQENLRNRRNITSKHIRASHSDEESVFDVRKNELLQLFLEWNQQYYATKLVLSYFVGYFVVGIVFHCNFLPWT